MSSKPSKNLTKNQPQTVDEERDPMLRALQKKIRNINKKLNEIVELALRKDLKPEQEEKISKKAQVLEEREKYQEMIEVYREIAAENEKLIRKNQIAELEDLAEIIASSEFNANLTSSFNQNLTNLVKVLRTPSQELTLQQRVSQISEALIQTANNSKLKVSVKQYIQANLEKKLEVKEQNKHEEEEQVNLASVAQKEEEKENTVELDPLVPQVSEVANPIEQNDVTEPHVEVNEIETPTQPIEGEEIEVQNNKLEKHGNEAKDGQRPRDEKRGRGRGGRGRGGRFNEDREGKPRKPTFKPKYEEQKPQENVDDSDQSEDSQPKAREFKREEVKELINDGFIVVGKPKPKARDQKQFHEHQHGKKFHPHHQKHDY